MHPDSRDNKVISGQLILPNLILCTSRIHFCDQKPATGFALGPKNQLEGIIDTQAELQAVTQVMNVLVTKKHRPSNLCQYETSFPFYLHGNPAAIVKSCGEVEQKAEQAKSC